jgi:intracellular protein transport protein USO1
MDFLNQTMFALRGPAGQPQTATDTISKLTDRLGPSTLLADRRAAVQTLKGLARQHTAEVSSRALQGLLAVLASDAGIDTDIGRAVLETLTILCTADGDNSNHELGLQNTDAVLAATDTIPTVFGLVADEQFYVRYGSLQLLAVLLSNRRAPVQALFLKSPAGAAGILTALEDRREIVRNGAFQAPQHGTVR